MRRHAMVLDESTSDVSPLTASTLEEQWIAGKLSNEPLHIDARPGEAHPTDQPESTSGGQPSETSNRPGRSPQRMVFPPNRQYVSPERQFDCDGWCRYTQAADDSCQNVVGIKDPI